MQTNSRQQQSDSSSASKLIPSSSSHQSNNSCRSWTQLRHLFLPSLPRSGNASIALLTCYGHVRFSWSRAQEPWQTLRLVLQVHFADPRNLHQRGLWNVICCSGRGNARVPLFQSSCFSSTRLSTGRRWRFYTAGTHSPSVHMRSKISKPSGCSQTTLCTHCAGLWSGGIPCHSSTLITTTMALV